MITRNGALHALGVAVAQKLDTKHETMLAQDGEITLSEDAHAMALIQWKEIAKHTHPELDLLFHVPNGGYRSIKTAGRMKAMGQKKGVSDYMLPVAMRPYYGLFLELKTDKGKPSGAQLDFLEAVKAQGYCGLIAKGWEEAAEMLINYLALEKKNG